MSLPAFKYLRPDSLEEAIFLLGSHPGEIMIMAGGTDLLVSLKQKLFQTARVLDVKAVSELRGLEFTETDGLKVGAATRLSDLAADKLVQTRYTGVAEAAQSVGAAAHRSMGTLGGNVCLNNRCWYFNQSPTWRTTFGSCYRLGGESCLVAKGTARCRAAYCGDTAPSLLVMGAQVKIGGPTGFRTVPLDELYTGDGKASIRLAPGELVVEITVPIPEVGVGTAYRKYRLRDSIDFPLAGAACAIGLDDEGTCTHARIALTAVGSRPERCPQAEDVLAGRKLTAGVISEAVEAARSQARPLRTTVMPPPYRRTMVALMVRNAIRAAASRCESGWEEYPS
ncbi:MAG: FAD binding domain-containing protein [Thermoleophilia bacterium]|nr:FAD binding domain-containing protein [Thermoleophilia bacterium]